MQIGHRREVVHQVNSQATLEEPLSPRLTQDSLPAAGQALPDGLSTRKIPLKGFGVVSLHLIPLSQASCRNHIARSGLNRLRSAAARETCGTLAKTAPQAGRFSNPAGRTIQRN